MRLCPTCGNLLLLTQNGAHQRFSCSTCAYFYPIVDTLVTEQKLEQKKKDDVLGGDEAWKNSPQMTSMCAWL